MTGCYGNSNSVRVQGELFKFIINIKQLHSIFSLKEKSLITMLQRNIDTEGNDHLWLNKPELPAANEENLKLEEMVNNYFKCLCFVLMLQNF